MKKLIIFSILLYSVISQSVAMDADVNCKSLDDAEVIKSTVNCVYSHSREFEPDELILKINKTTFPLEAEDVTTFPNNKNPIEILAIFDVSDPRRKETVENLYQEIDRILGLENDVIDYRRGVFSNKLKIYENNDEPFSFSAIGQATELLRSIDIALETLKQNLAVRKILVVISDGKAEDQAYTLEEITSKSKEYGIPIITLGVSEKLSDTPYLQLLRKLSQQTNGKFIDLTDKVVTADLQEIVIETSQPGGTISFSIENAYGSQNILVNLIDDQGSSIFAETYIKLPDNRSSIQKFLDYIIKNPWAAGLLIISIILLVFIINKIKIIRENNKYLKRVRAHLFELDGDGTTYPIRSNAITIGRGDQNTITLSNNSISSRHAEIHVTRSGEFELVDLGSTNGSKINDIDVTAQILSDGDIIELGEVRLKFSIGNN